MKKLILGIALLATTVASAQTTSYTAADVALHATAADCWMILNSNKVYNLSAFISLHPGGSGMASYCGKDGTQAFANISHSSNAVALETPYLIGALVTAPLAVKVTLSPANASASIGGTLQFTPTVTNSMAGVSWTIAPSTLGTISASGMFTAVTAGQGTITAASTQDPTKSASAVVTVNAVTPPTANTIVVTVSPSAMTGNVGSRIRFKATLTHSTQGVTWSTTGQIGTIDGNGVLTTALVPGTGTVIATSIDDPTRFASAQVTLNAVSCAPEVSENHPRSRRNGRDD
ncbi:MAG: cytochrome b5 domain-containing protein [Steroidobacteraceae bacterium]